MHSEARVRRVRQAEYVRLAGISVAHLYNLRNSVGYRRQAAVFEPTRPSGVSIAERRRPDPQGRPGYLRVDTVHQGDWDGAKGVYHINAVDAVLQWEVIGCASKISEQYLIPVLEGDAGAISVSEFGIPLRQRLGVYQPHSGAAAEQAAGGVHQEPRQPQPGQCLGGGKEWSGDSQAHRLRPHRRRTCRASCTSSIRRS